MPDATSNRPGNAAALISDEELEEVTGGLAQQAQAANRVADSPGTMREEADAALRTGVKPVGQV